MAVEDDVRVSSTTHMMERQRPLRSGRWGHRISEVESFHKGPYHSEGQNSEPEWMTRNHVFPQWMDGRPHPIWNWYGGACSVGTCGPTVANRCRIPAAIARLPRPNSSLCRRTDEAMGDVEARFGIGAPRISNSGETRL